MEVIFAPKAVSDLAFWKKSGNKIIQKKIDQLILAIQESPFTKIGKPEGLKPKFSGKWFRRINEEHRIVDVVIEDVLYIYSLKSHYKQ